MSSINSYDTALAATNGRDSKRIANNTYAERRFPDTMANPSVAIRFHKTDIVTYHPNGGVELNSGAWRTHITLGRINDYLPDGWNAVSTGGNWWLTTVFGSALLLIDGIVIDTYSGAPVSGFLERAQADALMLAQKELKKKVKGYLAIVPEKVEQWQMWFRRDGLINTAGDCLYCQGMVTDFSTGKVTESADHLWSHLNEFYLPLTLVLRAHEYAEKFARGGSWDRSARDFAITHIQYGMHDVVAKYLRKYLLDALNPLNRLTAPSPTAPGQQHPAHYLEWAKGALEYPSDFGYMGSDDTLYKASAPSWTRSRDSENLELANFDIVEKRLIEAFPDLWGNRVEDSQGHTYDRDDEKGYPQIYIMRSGHWAVGWIEQIVVPVLLDPAKPPSLDNLHPVWVMICQIKEQTDLYPYLDGAEELAAEMDTTQQVESIQSTIEWIHRSEDRPVPAEPTATDVLWEIQVLDDEYNWDSDQVVRALGSLAHTAYVEEIEDSQDELPL